MRTFAHCRRARWRFAPLTGQPSKVGRHRTVSDIECLVVRIMPDLGLVRARAAAANSECLGPIGALAVTTGSLPVAGGDSCRVSGCRRHHFLSGWLVEWFGDELLSPTSTLTCCRFTRGRPMLRPGYSASSRLITGKESTARSRPPQSPSSCAMTGISAPAVRAGRPTSSRGASIGTGSVDSAARTAS